MISMAVLLCRFVRNLEMAYKYSNKTLLDMLLKSKQLIPRLRYEVGKEFIALLRFL